MTEKENKLNEVVEAYEAIQQKQAELAAARSAFLSTLHDARSVRATQQEIADRLDLSRQRIAQFLNEK